MVAQFVKQIVKQIVTPLMAFVLIISMGAEAFAQATPMPPTAAAEQKSHSVGGPRKQLATIIFAGLAGAVLGLSTLSFYGRPQDKLANIAYGAAFGIMAGTGYVTYKAANNPQELYGDAPEGERGLDGERVAVQKGLAIKPLTLLSFDF